MTGQALSQRFRDERRTERVGGEGFEKVRAPADHMKKIRQADLDRRAAMAAADAARLELGQLFAELIENDWDLKAAAIEIGISRQTAYELVNRAISN